MKYLIKMLSIISLFSISLLSYASEITDAYTTGDTLTTSTLANIKDAVNDNNSRIGALEAAYAIGDVGPAGGRVFYVDADGRHGLEAAPTDQSVAIRWYNGLFTYTEARGDGLGSGEMNTMLIIANQGYDSSTYAAGICAKLVITNAGVDYGDWYLPSKYELNLMYLNIGQGNTTIGNVGGFASIEYWSSSEVDDNGDSAAWVQYFSNGSQRNLDKIFTSGVRAVRTF